MKRQLFCTLAMTAMTVIGAAAAGTDSLSKWVNPMIGTNGMGHTFPGACYPFGIVQLSPDTDTVPHNIDGRYQPEAYRYCAGYQYGDSTIVGFSHTHFSGTGHSDLGDDTAPDTHMSGKWPGPDTTRPSWTTTAYGRS